MWLNYLSRAQNFTEICGIQVNTKYRTRWLTNTYSIKMMLLTNHSRLLKYVENQ